QFDPHPRPVPDPRVPHVRRDRPRGGGRAVRNRRPRRHAQPVPAHQATAHLHPRALPVPAAGPAPSRAAGDHAGGDDLPVPRAELLSPQTNDLYGVTILEVDRQFRLLNRLDARQAHWTDSGWELRDGAFREIEPAGTVQTVPFTFTALELSEDIEEFTRIHKDFESMSYWELREYVAR